MRPRLAEPEAHGSLLGGGFGGCFNNSPERITHDAGVFPVGMVDAPELTGRLLSRARAHASSPAQAASRRMYQLHKVRDQS